MLTKEQFADFYANDRDELNKAFTEASSEEQDEYVKWLDELTPVELPNEDSVLAEAGELLGEDYEQRGAAADKATEEAVRQIMFSVTEANPREIAASKRAQRSNMLRSIRARYRLMEEFSISECARKIGRDPAEVSAYLISEIKRGTGVFTYLAEKNRFMLDNPFV